MSDPTNPGMPPPDAPDWRDMRREERWKHRREWHEARWGGNGPWVGGLLLIGLGLVFLLQNFGFPLPHNWWAVVLLVPAAFAFSSAWSGYQKSGRQVTASVRGALVGGSILTALAIVFFLDVDLGKFWPVILIIIGVAVLTGGKWRR